MINEYIEKHGRRLYGLCMTLCKNSYDAEDLYQETWLKACRRESLYNPSRPFEPWITGICVNTYRDILRKRKNSPFTDTFSTTEDKERAINGVADKAKQDYSDLHDAIDNLSEKLRVTVILFYFNDMDEVNTARTLKIPVGTVKSRLHKARTILRKELENGTDIQF